jgi:hypothetical protein
VNVQVLIDAIVRQTTVLIGQLATTGGVRAPLAHIANEVFLSLVAELSDQGVSQKVIADMFGMALRSYQQKVQRLSESATDRGLTLWEAVYAYLREREVASRADVLRRFRHDNEAGVRGILNDIVASGLVYRTGKGDHTVYRVASDEDLERAGGQAAQAAESLVWLTVYRQGPIGRAALSDLLPLDAQAVSGALELLVSEGRIERVSDEGGGVYASARCLIPIGDPSGWEAGLFDHFQALVGAMTTKLRNGTTRALPDDQVGGSTFSFDVWPGHPHDERVRSLLRDLRAQVGAVWDDVATYNASHQPSPNQGAKVTLYFGQSVQTDALDRNEVNA